MSKPLLLVGLVFVLSAPFAQGQITANAAPPPLPAIRNIDLFLLQCPDRDPASSIIRQDFELRRDGVLAPEPACTEPVSAIPTAQYSDELIVRQALRTMYYMDRGQSGHLPWTSGTLYDWVKTKIKGINIVTGLSGGGCCTTIAGKTFISIGSKTDSNRVFARAWPGISSQIDFYAHESRHVDGFPHSSCCGIANGCDNTYDPANLSPYGIQWWLNNLWLDGTINVGYDCLTPSEVSQITGSFLATLNSQFRSRFCTNPPPLVSSPDVPGGACPPGPRRRAARK
jgi:hypothetical protein